MHKITCLPIGNLSPFIFVYKFESVVFIVFIEVVNEFIDEVNYDIFVSFVDILDVFDVIYVVCVFDVVYKFEIYVVYVSCPV